MISPKELIVPSLLDRLVDDEPDLVSGRTGPYQSLVELKACVQRDLQNLLNTRWRDEVFPPDLELLRKSVLNYGMPDFLTEEFDDINKRNRFAKRLKEIIALFEPRLEKVRVQLLQDPDEGTSRTIRFRIEAVIRANPAPPEPVSFDSDVEPATGKFVVTGGT